MPALRTRIAGLVLVLACAGCGSDGPRTEAGPASSATFAAENGPDGKPIPLGCEGSVPEEAVQTPPGLIVPDGARVIVRSALLQPDDSRVTVVDGYVELAPTALLRGMRRLRGATISFVEDEEIEAEVLIGDRRSRNFWKVVRTCEVASRFTALVVAASDGAAVGGAVQTQTKRGRRR